MKIKLLSIIILLFVGFGFSQQKMIVPEYEPGQLIVKLKDDVSAGITYGDNNNTKSGIARNEMTEDIGKILGISQKIKKQEVLFSLKSIERSIIVRNEMIRQENELNNKPKNQGAQGSDPSEDNQQYFSMKNVIKIEFEDPMTNIYEIIDQLKDNPKVDYVEPNYIFSINDYTVESEIIYDKDLKSSSSSNTTTTTPSDPLYSEQSGIVKTNIDDVWTDYGTGDGSQIVAVLDTGVDYTHPDLEANIWVNEAELNGVEGYDDDGNGYVDDIRGWDFINEDNAPLDDNMHGTHVAGIIGAVGNNEKGIAGAAWNVKIMPIKVFQSSGRAGTIDVVEGIEYAINKNATILNMSFASSNNSKTLKTSLENAYIDNILMIAASGNNSRPIGPCQQCYPYFPAAYRFVIGVEDYNGGYDNYDQDGPIFSRHPNNLNYELQSFGSSILSTVPNGGYRKLTGTSMAAPLVAGSMSLYNIYREDKNETREIRIAKTVNSTTNTDGYFDLKHTLENEELNPILRLSSINYNDEIDGNENKNSIVDAGEKIEIDVTVVNWFAASSNIEMKLEFGGNEIQNEFFASKVTITDNEVKMSPLGEYGTRRTSSESDNFSIEINDDVIHDTEILIKISVWDTERPDDIFILNDSFLIFNQVRLPEYINSDYVVEEGLYFVDNLVVVDNANLTLSPGVTIIFGGDNPAVQKGIRIRNGGKIFANGTKEKKITWRVINGGFDNKNLIIQQADWNVFEGEYTLRLEFIDYLKNSEARDGNINIQESDLSDNDQKYYENINLNGYLRSWFAEREIRGINVFGSGAIYQISDGRANPEKVFNEGKKQVNVIHAPLYGGQSYLNPTIEVPSGNTSNLTYKVPDLYSNIIGNYSILRSVNYDYYNNTNVGILDFSTFKQTPHENAPGFLHNFKINDKKAKYIAGPIFPLGQKKEVVYNDQIFFTESVSLGEYEFKLYFNREMDKSINPTISYGLVDPYLQTIVSEEGTWSDDGKIYTVTHDVNIGTSDGYNRILVTGAKDLNGFEMIESKLYHFDLSSAGSASTGFAATPGLGEITLEWESPREEDLADVLGYNMYRYELKEDDTYSDTLKINKNLITDLKYEDFDVVRNKQYFYAYKILRTSFEETDYSTTVTTELLTAELGDSNGDSSVNVIDVVNTVDYILGNNPTPFIDYATDVNDDSNINVLDVVGIVDLVLKGDSARPGNGSGFRTSSSNGVDYYPNNPVGKAVFYWEGNDLYVESEYNIGGMQLVFDKDFKYILSDELSKFEHIDFDQDNQKVFMFYSFNGVETQKKTKLLTRLNEDVSLDIDKAVVGTPNGLKLEASFEERILPDLDAPEQGDQLEILSVSPNPSNGKIKVRYYLPEKMDKMVVRLYNTIGQLIWTSDDLNNNPGQSEKDFDLNPVTKGIYIFSMDAFKSGEIKNRTYKRLVIE